MYATSFGPNNRFKSLMVSLFAAIGCVLALFARGAVGAQTKAEVSIGSKIFTESYLLAEIASQQLEATGKAAIHRNFGLGETALVYQSLISGKIDLYPEYTGTIVEALLKRPLSSFEQIQSALKERGLIMSRPLGFNNTYGIGVPEPVAEKLGLRTLADLKRTPDLRAAFSPGFVERRDGYYGVSAFYGFKLRDFQPVTHALAYEAIARGSADLVDVYTTDAMIEKLNLRVLEDNRHFFPPYLAVFLARVAFVEQHPDLWEAIEKLGGRFNEAQMIRLNGQVEIEGETVGQVAAGLLSGRPIESLGYWRNEFWVRTREHLYLVGLSLLAAILLGVPAGILCTRYRLLGQVLLALSGVFQTIPSLALLCFLIPFFGIGNTPALVALFLYALLPIVIGAHTGIVSIDPAMKEIAAAIGLTPWQRLRLVEIPMAARSILAGIKTSAIIGIGTATIAALIGAGGYGVPIMTGLTMNNTRVVLEGAIPSAALAVVVYFGFGLLEKFAVPRGLRQ